MSYGYTDGKSVHETINDLIDKRLEYEREILWTYYKRAKLMCNEDARGAVSSHFSYGGRYTEQGKALLKNYDNRKQSHTK